MVRHDPSTTVDARPTEATTVVNQESIVRSAIFYAERKEETDKTT